MRISDWSSDVCSSDLTEVTNLPNLMGYLRFGRSLPVVRFEDSYNKVASIGEAFEERGNAPIRMAVPTPPKPPEQRQHRTDHRHQHIDERPAPVAALDHRRDVERKRGQGGEAADYANPYTPPEIFLTDRRKE